MFDKSIVCIIFVTCAWSELVFNDIKDKMAWELLKLLPGKNLVVSSLMVRFPLCKLASVATGEAKEELMTALGYTNDTWLLGCYARFREIITMLMKVDLTCVNKMYVSYTDAIDPAFITNSELNFGVAVHKVGFNYPKRAVQFINHMIGTATYKRVTDVLTHEDVDQNATMIIVNAIHFKGTWEFPFNYKLTGKETFHYPNGKVVKVPMMQKTDAFPYVDAGEFQAVKINFGSAGTSITFVLPFDKRGLPGLVNKAYEDPNFFKPFFYHMRPRPVKLKIPRFQIKTYVDWTGFLQEMGLYAIFNCSSSDMARIFKEGRRDENTICLNKAKQKIFIQIDEMGVSRHIFNEIRQRHGPDMAARSAPLIGSVDLVFDRPFLFIVNLEFTSYNRHELLTGVYYGPE